MSKALVRLSEFKMPSLGACITRFGVPFAGVLACLFLLSQIVDGSVCRATVPDLASKAGVSVPKDAASLAEAIRLFEIGEFNSAREYIRVAECGEGEEGFTIPPDISDEANPLIIYFESKEEGDFSRRYRIEGQVKQYSSVWWYGAYFVGGASVEDPSLALYPGADGTRLTRSKFVASRAIGTGAVGVQGVDERPVDRLSVMFCHFHTPVGTVPNKHIYVDMRRNNEAQANDYVFYRNYHQFEGEKVNFSMGIYSNPGYAGFQPRHENWLIQECYFDGVAHMSYYLKHSRNGRFLRNVHNLYDENGQAWGSFGMRGHLKEGNNTVRGEKVLSLFKVIFNSHGNVMEDCDLGGARLEVSAGSQKNPEGNGKLSWGSSGARIRNVSADTVMLGDLPGSATDFFEKLEDVEFHDCSVGSWMDWEGHPVDFIDGMIDLRLADGDTANDLNLRLGPDLEIFDAADEVNGPDPAKVSRITKSDVGPGVKVRTEKAWSGY